jgi:uncharacterized protein YcbX
LLLKRFRSQLLAGSVSVLWKEKRQEMKRVIGIHEYPVKGLLGCPRSSVRLGAKGQIGNDRRWWFTEEGQPKIIVAGKWAHRTSNRNFWRIRPEFDVDCSEVRLALDRSTDDISIADDVRLRLAHGDKFTRWMESVLGVPLQMHSNAILGNPDTLKFPAFTLISEGTVEEIANWFNWSPDDVVRRLRVNLVVGGVPAFEEYAFVGRLFSVGESTFKAAQACPRCPVPGIDPFTGEATEEFRAKFVEKMKPHSDRLSPPLLRSKTGFVAALHCTPIRLVKGSTIDLDSTFEVH